MESVPFQNKFFNVLLKYWSRSADECCRKGSDLAVENVSSSVTEHHSWQCFSSRPSVTNLQRLQKQRPWKKRRIRPDFSCKHDQVSSSTQRKELHQVSCSYMHTSLVWQSSRTEWHLLEPFPSGLLKCMEAVRALVTMLFFTGDRSSHSVYFPTL